MDQNKKYLHIYAFTAEGRGSIPGRGTKIPQAVWHAQEILLHDALKVH